MAVQIYDHREYKEILKKLIGEKQKSKKGLTLKRISELIQIQYTYLSKVLNHDGFHLGESHTLSLCGLLELSMNETKFIMKLRAMSSCESKELKNFYLNEIEDFLAELKIEAKIKTDHEAKLNDESFYLLNPLCTIIHVALTTEYYRKDPLKLCAACGVTRSKLKDILKILENYGILVLKPNGLEIEKMLEHRIHIGRTNPLLRVHQQLLKQFIQERIFQAEEESKFSFLVNFTSTKEGFQEIKADFQKLIEKASKRNREKVKPSENKNLLSLNFDLLLWPEP